MSVYPTSVAKELKPEIQPLVQPRQSIISCSWARQHAPATQRTISRDSSHVTGGHKTFNNFQALKITASGRYLFNKPVCKRYFPSWEPKLPLDRECEVAHNRDNSLHHCLAWLLGIVCGARPVWRAIVQKKWEDIQIMRRTRGMSSQI